MFNLVANGPSGYNLNNSLRFRSSASAYLSRTPASATNRTTWTLSMWVKRGKVSSESGFFGAGPDGSNFTLFEFTAGDQMLLYSANGGATSFLLTTTQVFRDPSAWYHIVISIDTTQATSSNRVKLYINGSQVTSFSSATYPAQNYQTFIDNTTTHVFGNIYNGGAPYFDGYMTEINFIDGQALTPSSFGNTNAVTGVWQPAKYTGTYGTNGFYLNFSSIATTSGSNTGLGKDFSGNTNYWNTNNISVTSGITYDAMTDVPTLTSTTTANYGTWNPLNAFNTTTSSANLNFTMSANNTQSIQGTFGMTSGKWYFESAFTSADVVNLIIGIVGANYSANGSRPYTQSTGYMYISSGNKINNGSGAAYGSTYTTNDIIGVAVDLDNGKIWFSKNGTWQASGDPAAGTNPAYTGLSGSFVASVTNGNDGVNYAGWINCGQRPFSYTAPSGFNPLNTYNLPTSTIVQGNKYMDATAYTGTNGSPTTQVISSNFQPDFLWFKKRSAAYDHALIDTNRGITKQLYSNLTNAEGTDSDVLTAIGASSFTVGNSNYSNYGTLVAWTWKANGGTTSSNTQGSITSTVQANTTAGFSIVTYTGNLTGSPSGGNDTVGHGLGVAPKMIIFKRRDGTSPWIVWHTSLSGVSYVVQLNATSAEINSATAPGWLGGTPSTPTSTIFGTNYITGRNVSGQTQVAYCFAEISGFSKFGSYTGNGSTDGTFVYTGFRPKYILIKVTSTTEDWYIYDTSRITYNLGNIFIYADLSNAENTGATGIDILSNGFKQRQTGVGNNSNGATYIYAAFAENPFKNSLAR